MVYHNILLTFYYELKPIWLDLASFQVSFICLRIFEVWRKILFLFTVYSKKWFLDSRSGWILEFLAQPALDYLCLISYSRILWVLFDHFHCAVLVACSWFLCFRRRFKRSLDLSRSSFRRLDMLEGSPESFLFIISVLLKEVTHRLGWWQDLLR